MFSSNKMDPESLEYMKIKLLECEDYAELTSEDRIAVLTLIEYGIDFYIEGCYQSFIHQNFTHRYQ